MLNPEQYRQEIYLTNLEKSGHKSNYIEFIIDPDSMLLPSIEIQKQTFMQLFPVIVNQITTIFSLRNVDPEAAMSQLMALEKNVRNTKTKYI